MKNILFVIAFMVVFAFASVKSEPMYKKINFQIKIGAYQLNGFEKITIDKSQQMLSHSCFITIPGMVRGVPVKIEEKIKRGDEVEIKLGYDGVLQTEFKGFLKAIYPGSPMRLECEDSTYQFRRLIGSKILKNVDTKAILNYVLNEVNPQLSKPFILKTDISGYKWDKFAIHEETGYEVLDRLRKESGLTIYAKENELHCHLAYTEKTGKCVYEFVRNIERTDDLQYMKAQDAKVLIRVIGRTSKGAKVETEVGERGGSVVTLQRPTISEKETLEGIGREELKKMTFDGYRGKIKGWLVPFCTVGYSVKIVDEEYPDLQGVFYVIAQKLEVSKAGCVRTVTPGFRVG